MSHSTSPIAARDKIVKLISSGQGKPDWKAAFKRIPEAFAKVISFQPVFRFRLWSSILHALIGWGFLVFVVVNLSDLIYGYTGFSILNQTGLFGDVYRLLADIANVAILVGMIAMVIRRFILRPATLSTRKTTLLNPNARTGISRELSHRCDVHHRTQCITISGRIFQCDIKRFR